MDKKTIRRRLWDSLEMRGVRQNILLCFLAAGLSILAGHRDLPLETVIAVTCVVCGAFLVGYLWLGFQILRKPEGCTFHRVVLGQPQWKWQTKSMYFTVELKASDGRILTKNTRAIFARRGKMGTRAEDYVNQEVTIAYNEETGRIIVLG